MQARISRLCFFPFIAFFIGFMAFISCGLYFYFNSYQKFKDIAQSFESSYQLDYLTRTNPLQSLKVAVQSRDTARASTELNYFQNSLQKINVKIVQKDAAKLYQNAKALEQELEELIALPSLFDLSRLFQKKIFQLKLDAEKNDWKNLNSVTIRILERLTEMTRVDAVSSRLVKQINRDLSRISDIAKKSDLKSSNKQKILSSLNSAKLEWNMLQKNIFLGNKLLAKIQALKIQHKSWIQGLAPELSFAKMGLDQFKTDLATVTLVFLLFSSLFLLFLYVRSKHWKLALKGESEHFYLSLLNQKFRKRSPEDVVGFSDQFNLEIKRFAQYFHQKIDVSDCFHNSLPFPTLVLDERTRIVYSNDELAKQWNIPLEKISKEVLSWEDLKKMTTLGDADPVQLLLQDSDWKQSVQQIKVLVDEDRSVPYEMYLRKVVSEEHTFCVLYFYPLSHFVESIENQAKSLVAPMQRTLQEMIKGDFDEKFREKMNSEFRVSGQSGIFELFCQLDSQHRESSDELLNQLEALEGSHTDQMKGLDDFGNMTKELEQEQRQSVTNVAQIKSTFISLSQKNSETWNIVHDLLHFSEEGVKKFSEAVDKNREFYELFQRGQELNFDIHQTKNLLRESKKELLGSGKRIEKQFRGVDSKTDSQALLPFIESFTEDLERLEKIFSQFEILLSKSELLFSHTQIKKIHSLIESHREDLSKFKTIFIAQFDKSSQIEREIRRP